MSSLSDERIDYLMNYTAGTNFSCFRATQVLDVQNLRSMIEEVKMALNFWVKFFWDCSFVLLQRMFHVLIFRLSYTIIVHKREVMELSLEKQQLMKFWTKPKCLSHSLFYFLFL